MPLKLLDTVELKKDIPGHDLKKGARGVVMGLFEPGGIEVEFQTGAGRPGELVTMSETDVRLVVKPDTRSL